MDGEQSKSWKKNRFKVSTGEIVDALYETGGNICKAAAWFRENKGITISDRAISKRIHGNRRLEDALVDAREKEYARFEKRLPQKRNILDAPIKRGPKPRVSDTLLREALIQAHGIHFAAVQYLYQFHNITVSMDYISHRVQSSPELQAAKKTGWNALLDIAEHHLVEKILDRDLKAIMFLLKTRGKDRGYLDTGSYYFRKEQELARREEELRQKEQELAAKGEKRDLPDKIVEIMPVEKRMIIAEAHFNFLEQEEKREEVCLQNKPSEKQDSPLPLLPGRDPSEDPE